MHLLYSPATISYRVVFEIIAFYISTRRQAMRTRQFIFSAAFMRILTNDNDQLRHLSLVLHLPRPSFFDPPFSAHHQPHGYSSVLYKMWVLVTIRYDTKKVKGRIVLREIHLRTTGRHLSNGITQCYLLADRGGRPAFTTTGQVGTRFIDPVRMKG